MAPFLTDWRGVFHGSACAIALPASTSDVAAVVRYCAERAIPVIPQGGNTGLAGGATPVGLQRAVVISLSRMRRIRSIDSAANTISVDAGCVVADVQAAATHAGRAFPLAFGAQGSAQIGGCIATNAGGFGVLRYGATRALVLGIEVVLPDGSVLEAMRALRKDNAGYDVKHAFIGSEGTLGVITGAVLRLVPQLQNRVTALISLAALDDAVGLYARLQEAIGDALVACEFFGDDAIQLRLGFDPSLRRPLRPEPWYVLVEAASPLEGLSDALERTLDLQTASGSIRECAIASNARAASALWAWRESITESERRLGTSAKHDVSVPVSAIPAFVRDATAAVKAGFPACAVLAFGHFGDGNVHFNVVLAQSGSASDVNGTVHDVVGRYAGSITAEHGIGRYRNAELARLRSGEELALMRAMKRAIDPHNLMNPGAVFSGA